MLLSQDRELVLGSSPLSRGEKLWSYGGLLPFSWGLPPIEEDLLLLLAKQIFNSDYAIFFLVDITGGTLCRNNRRLIGTPLIVITQQS